MVRLDTRRNGFVLTEVEELGFDLLVELGEDVADRDLDLVEHHLEVLALGVSDHFEFFI